MKRCLILALLVTLSDASCALTARQLDDLKQAIHEMCLLPDRTGDYLKLDGEAKAGTAVPIRLVKAEISGRISYEKWKGIPITLDKYRKDPRECALEMLKVLLPAFSDK